MQNESKPGSKFQLIEEEGVPGPKYTEFFSWGSDEFG